MVTQTVHFYYRTVGSIKLNEIDQYDIMFVFYFKKGKLQNNTHNRIPLCMYK